MGEIQMKPIVCTGAMDAETLYLMGALADAEPVGLGPWKCVRGMLDGFPTVIVRTNQGMANAAAATALAIERFAPCAVLNQGTSGGHAPDLHTGDLVIGETVVNLGAWRTPDRPRGAGIDPVCGEPLGLEIANPDPGDGPKVTAFRADAALMRAAAAIPWDRGRVVRGVIGSGDWWNNELDRIAWLHGRFDTMAEEMEAAASAQICQAYGMPFLTVRILSNTAVHGEPFDERTGEQCQKFARALLRNYRMQ